MVVVTGVDTSSILLHCGKVLTDSPVTCAELAKVRSGLSMESVLPPVEIDIGEIGLASWRQALFIDVFVR